MKTFLEKYFYPLLLIMTASVGGYAVRFELLAGEVKENREDVNDLKKKQSLVTWLLCKDAIEKGKEEAEKRCKEVLVKENL